MNHGRCKLELTTLHGEVILVAHSLGCSVLLRYLLEARVHNPIAGLFLIASPYWDEMENWKNDDFTLPVDFASKLPQVPTFFYHSRDDEIVPFSHLALYTEKVPQATIRRLDNYGHDFDQKPFVELIADIKTVDLRLL